MRHIIRFLVVFSLVLLVTSFTFSGISSQLTSEPISLAQHVKGTESTEESEEPAATPSEESGDSEEPAATPPDDNGDSEEPAATPSEESGDSNNGKGGNQNQECDLNESLDKDGNCVPNEIQKSQDNCNPDEYFDSQEKTCVPIVVQQDGCQQGFTMNNNGECEPADCPDGFHLGYEIDPSRKKCVRDGILLLEPTESDCSEGYVLDPIDGSCVNKPETPEEPPIVGGESIRSLLPPTETEGGPFVPPIPTGDCPSGQVRDPIDGFCVDNPNPPPSEDCATGDKLDNSVCCPEGFHSGYEADPSRKKCVRNGTFFSFEPPNNQPPNNQPPNNQPPNNQPPNNQPPNNQPPNNQPPKRLSPNIGGRNLYQFHVADCFKQPVGNASITLKRVMPDSGELLSGGQFRITPNPYTLNGYFDINDNDLQTDREPCNGIVILDNVKYSKYIIDDIIPSNDIGNDKLSHRGMIYVNRDLQNPVINFVYRDLASGPSTKEESIIPNQYIIFLKDQLDLDPGVIADELSARGAEILQVYDSLNGIAAKITDDELIREIQLDNRTLLVGNDILGHLASSSPLPSPSSSSSNNIRRNVTSDIISTGVDRVDGDLNPIVRIQNLRSYSMNGGIPSNIGDNLEKGVDVDIAILDTGVSLSHPDLNVYKNVSFINGTLLGDDDQGHGSHLAGIAAAKENTIGEVGIAPGARIWAVKVCDKLSNCPLSSMIAGIEYVTEHADEIEVVNISVDYPDLQELNDVIRKSVNAGVTYVVAAGNKHQDAARTSPANSPDAIAVSAFGDSDGKCGGIGRDTFVGSDDTFANFSNYGSVIDMAAPGVDIFSTYIGDEYAVDTGTSMAAPHVTGAAALYKSVHPSASPSEVHNALTVLASTLSSRCDGNGMGYFDADADNLHEPVLNVREIK